MCGVLSGQVEIKRKYRHVWQPYDYSLYHATVYTKNTLGLLCS